MKRNVGKAAVSMEEFQEWDRTGKIKRKRRGDDMAPVETPTFDDQIEIKNIDMADISGINGGQRDVRKGPDGVRHVGFNVAFIRKSDNKVVAGWMTEGDYISFRRSVFRSGAVNTDSMEF